MLITPKLAAHLSQRARELHLTQSKIARMIGCSQTTVQKIFTAEARDTKFIPALWKALDLPRKELKDEIASFKRPEDRENAELETARETGEVFAGVDCTTERLHCIEPWYSVRES